MMYVSQIILLSTLNLYSTVYQLYLKKTRRKFFYTLKKYQWYFYIVKMNKPGFPGGAVVENLPANAGDTGSSPSLGRSHMPRSN